MEKFEDDFVGSSFNYNVINKNSSGLDKYDMLKELTITVIIKSECMYNEESSYGVYEVEDLKGNLFKINGVFIPKLNKGLSYDVNGKIKVFRNERQLNIIGYKTIKPTNERGVIEYLKTLKGLDKRAEQIYELYGENTIELLIADPMKIAKEVKGVGEKTALEWKSQLEKLKGTQEVMTTLLSYGLTIKDAKKVFDKYREGVVYKIQENPYMLLQEINSFNFNKCDKIAVENGYDPQGMFRIQEGIIHVLKESSFEGNCFLPIEVLNKHCQDLLNISLNEIEMRSLLKKNSGKKQFIYKYGTFNYTINYDSLVRQKQIYDKNKKKDRRFIVVRITTEDIEQEIKNLMQVNRIIVEDDKVYLPNIYTSEDIVAEKIVTILKNKTQEFSELETDLDNLLRERSIVLEQKQKEAVLTFAEGKGGFYVLSGSAGCGKTFTLNIILEMIELQYKKREEYFDVKVFAPTGKASKVASKSTHRPCSTVHRGLRYNPEKGFEFNANNPIQADCVIVDESSMLDIILSKDLLSAIPDNTKVIFLGDIKQLPSVGPGNVLLDLINSGIVPVITLNVVKRQGEESGIIKNANRIIDGEMIGSCKDTLDAYVMRKENIQDCQRTILKSLHEIRRIYNYSMEDIQVLCPQKNSEIGTNVLNYLIQQEFNPGNNDIIVLNKRIKVHNFLNNTDEKINLYFKKGDKVMHTKNNYNMIWYFKSKYLGYQEDLDTIGITNGECGIIEDIISEEYFGKKKIKLIVKYDDKYVIYQDNFDELEHAYAMTIHKSQGSQWEAVIIPVMMQNLKMLDNNLFYTGYTRARKFITTIGQINAFKYAIETFNSRSRFTGLQEKLKICACS